MENEEHIHPFYFHVQQNPTVPLPNKWTWTSYSRELRKGTKTVVIDMWDGRVMDVKTTYIKK